MTIHDEILATLPNGKVDDIRIGLHWTAVAVTVGDEQHCGLASTLTGEHVHGELVIPQAGRLEQQSALELAHFVKSDYPTLRSIGTAAINALLPPCPEYWIDGNAEEVLAGHGAEKTVALIGHFPFIPSLRERVGKLHVLELNPQPGDLPASAAPQILPQADVVAITSMTLINNTLGDLLALCRPGARIVLVGPSTPLSPVLFDHGIELLSGSFVTEIDPVLRAISQGAAFRQVHKAGVRLVTMVGEPVT